MMILKEHNISVRLPQERAIDTGIVFVQNDKDVYKLNVRVFDGDNEIDYSQVESATITFSKADGTVVQGDMQKATNMLTHYLGTNEIAAPGKLLASIQLLGANERLTTARFVFTVEKDLITPDTVKSTSEFPILQQLKQELEDIDVVELTNQFNSHKAEYTNLIKKTTYRHMVDVSTISTGNTSTFTVGFLPKKITALSSIAGESSYSHSIQYALEKGIMISAYQSNVKNTAYDQYMSLVYVFTDANNGISGRITSFTEDGFVVTWEKTGSISGVLIIEMLAEGV